MRKTPKKQWSDFSPAQRRAIVAAGVITSALQALMLWDLWRRPAEEVRGAKLAWVAASFVRPFGQIAYLLWGRQAPGGAESAREWPEPAPERPAWAADGPVG